MALDSPAHTPLSSSSIHLFLLFIFLLLSHHPFPLPPCFIIWPLWIPLFLHQSLSTSFSLPLLLPFAYSAFFSFPRSFPTSDHPTLPLLLPSTLYLCLSLFLTRLIVFVST